MSETTQSPTLAVQGPYGSLLRSRTAASPAVLPTALGLPVAAWQVVFFAAPLLFLIVITFWQVRSFRLEPAFVTDNWSRILGSTTFYRALTHTLRGEVIHVERDYIHRVKAHGFGFVEEWEILFGECLAKQQGVNSKFHIGVWFGTSRQWRRN